MTDLNFRPVILRLAVAFTCDAECGGFSRVNPGSTLERVFADGTHPYMKMWDRIIKFYDSRNWGEHCDESLNHEVAGMASKGFISSDGRFITPDDMKNAAARWKEYGWYDYEMKRASKIRKTKKWGSRAGFLALAAFGIPLTGEGG